MKHTTQKLTHKPWLLMLLGLCLLVMFISSSVGAVEISWRTQLAIWLEAFSATDVAHALESRVFWHIRLPRTLMGLLIGGALALSGATLQGIFRNPLADPGLIGVSSGGALAVVGLIVFGGPVLAQLSLSYAQISLYFTPFAAFVGAMVTVYCVMRLSQRHGKTDMATMLLAGIAINAFAGAMIGFATYAADDKQLRNLTMWTLGSLSGASWQQVGIVALVILPCMVALCRNATTLNLLLLGTREAGHLGVDVSKVQRQCVALSALIVAVGVGFVGMIGFVGLVVPHLARLTRGADHRWVLPASILMGSVMLTLADVFSRTIVAPAELPIGVVTSFLGAPFFVWLLWQKRSQMG